MADGYIFDKRTAEILRKVAQQYRVEGSNALVRSDQPQFKIAIAKVVTSQISAGTESSPASGSAQVISSVSGTQRAQQTITVYNPHDSALPVDTYLFIVDTGYDWYVLSAINYCP